MAFSFLNQELAIDLGTANTVIYQNDQIVLDEPSIIAIDNNTGKCIAFGQQAKLMHEKVNPGMKTIRPLREGRSHSRLRCCGDDDKRLHQAGYQSPQEYFQS